MYGPREQSIHSVATHISRAVGVICIVTALLVLAGWFLGFEGLRRFDPDQVSMKANTAVGFLLSGSLLWMAQRGRGWMVATLGIGLGALALATISQYVFSVDLGIDQWLLDAPTGGVLTSSPGRMAPSTGGGFLLICLAVWLFRIDTRIALGMSRIVAAVLLLVGLASILGYAYGAPRFYMGFDGVTAMSLPSGVLFVLISIGLIWLKPSTGFPALLASETVVGAQFRAVVPLVLAPPLFVGAAVAAGYGKYFEGPFAIALTSLGSVIAAGLVAAVLLIVLQQSESEVTVKTRALNAVHNGIFVVDFTDDTRPITIVNEAFTAITGYTASAIHKAGLPILWTDLPEDQPVIEQIEECFDLLGSGTFELLNRRADDEFFWNRLSLSPVVDQEGVVTHYVGVIDDISARRENQHRVESALQEANEANEMRNTFVRLVSHELRTPLNAALTWIRLMEADPRPQTIERGMTIVANSIESQSRLVDDLVDVTRFAAAGVKLEFKNVDAHSVILAAVNEMRPTVEEHHTLDVITTQGDYHCDMDALRVQQIVRNLLTNASKYTPPPGEIIVSLRATDEAMELQVKDNGKGLTDAEQEHVFDTFWRAQSHQPGLGVGLSIVASLVAAHNGDIDVASEGTGKGSLFTVSLPKNRSA